MTRNLHIITGLLLVFCQISYGQKVVSIDGFQPFERSGDTIYYNRNNYEFVVSHKDKKVYYNNIKLYYLYNLNDYSTKTGFYPFTARSKKHTISLNQNDFDCMLCLTDEWREIDRVEPKDIKIKKNDFAYYMEENKLLFPGMPKDSSLKKIYVPISLFPELEPIVKKFYNFLNFENGQLYSIYFDWDSSMTTKVEVPILCNPEIHGTGPRYNELELKHILDSLLVNVKWPVLKVGDTVISYNTVQSGIAMDDYVGQKLEKVRNDHRLRPLFNSNDSILTLIDSLNYISTIFILGKVEKDHPTSYSITVPGILDYKKTLVDLNNDGRKDYVLDTIFNNYNYEDGSTQLIHYIPNYDTTQKYFYNILQSIGYTKDLGNHFYYLVTTEEEASIYYIKNNEIIDVISISTDFIDKKGKVHYKSFTHFLVRNHPEYTITHQATSKKARELHKVIEEKIKHYVKYPEKLPVDFPMN